MTEIILFNAKDREKESIEKICERENVKLKEISMADLDQKVGYLAGLDGFDKKDIVSEFNPKYDFTFMLFKDFEKKELFDFIDLMKEDKIFIAHKASITDNNIKWDLRFLLDENDEEHKTMAIINDINRFVKIAHEDKLKNGENPKIASLVQEINAYFSNPNDFDINKAYKYRDDLKKLVDNL